MFVKTNRGNSEGYYEGSLEGETRIYQRIFFFLTFGMVEKRTKTTSTFQFLFIYYIRNENKNIDFHKLKKKNTRF